MSFYWRKKISELLCTQRTWINQININDVEQKHNIKINERSINSR